MIWRPSQRCRTVDSKYSRKSRVCTAWVVFKAWKFRGLLRMENDASNCAWYHLRILLITMQRQFRASNASVDSTFWPYRPIAKSVVTLIWYSDLELQNLTLVGIHMLRLQIYPTTPQISYQPTNCGHAKRNGPSMTTQYFGFLFLSNAVNIVAGEEDQTALFPHGNETRFSHSGNAVFILVALCVHRMLQAFGSNRNSANMLDDKSLSSNPPDSRRQQRPFVPMSSGRYSDVDPQKSFSSALRLTAQSVKS